MLLQQIVQSSEVQTWPAKQVDAKSPSRTLDLKQLRRERPRKFENRPAAPTKLSTFEFRCPTCPFYGHVRLISDCSRVHQLVFGNLDVLENIAERDLHLAPDLSGSRWICEKALEPPLFLPAEPNESLEVGYLKVAVRFHEENYSWRMSSGHSSDMPVTRPMHSLLR